MKQRTSNLSGSWRLAKHTNNSWSNSVIYAFKKKVPRQSTAWEDRATPHTNLRSQSLLPLGEGSSSSKGPSEPGHLCRQCLLDLLNVSTGQTKTDRQNRWKNGHWRSYDLYSAHTVKAHVLLLNTDMHWHMHMITTPQAYAENHTVVTQSRPCPHDKKKHT